MSEKIIFIGLCLFLIGLVILGLYGAIQSEKKWIEFAKQHDCKIVEHKESYTSTGYGYGMTTNGEYGYGMISQIHPEKTAYLCDDGVVYWR